MSAKYTFDKDNAMHVLKVFAFTVGSMGVTLLANLVPQIHSTDPTILLIESIFVNNVAVALEQWLTQQAANEQAQITPPITQ